MQKGLAGIKPYSLMIRKYKITYHVHYVEALKRDM